MVSRPSISSAPAGYRFPRAVIAVAVRWYLRYGLCYRDVEELLAERGIRVDHRSTGGCRRSRRSSSTRPVRPGTRRVIAGLSTRLTSRSPGPWTYLDRAVDPARAGRRRPAVRTARRHGPPDVVHPPSDRSALPVCSSPCRCARCGTRLRRSGRRRPLHDQVPLLMQLGQTPQPSSA
jgi:hypothetical protein